MISLVSQTVAIVVIQDAFEGVPVHSLLYDKLYQRNAELRRLLASLEVIAEAIKNARPNYCS